MTVYKQYTVEAKATKNGEWQTLTIWAGSQKEALAKAYQRKIVGGCYNLLMKPYVARIARG